MAPHTPSQKGKTERCWRSVVDMASCSLHDSKLQKKYWSHAMRYTVYIQNRAYRRRTRKTAFEIFTITKQNLTHIAPTSSAPHARSTTNLIKQSSTLAVSRIFIGISPLNNTYLVLDPSSCRVKSSRNPRYCSTLTTLASVTWADKVYFRENVTNVLVAYATNSCTKFRIRRGNELS